MAPKKKAPPPAAPSAPARQAAAPARTPAAPPSRPAPASRPQAQGPAWNANLSANSPKAVAVNNAAADLINRAATAGSEAEANRLISQAQALAAGGSGSPGLLDLISRQARGIESRFTAAGPIGGEDTGTKEDPYEAYYRAQEQQRRTNAIAVVRGLLGQYGLESLYNTIVGYIQDGYDPDSVMALIRTTPEYKQRFPAMEALAKKGRAISEAEYIAYERDAAGLERQYGLPAGMLGRDKVAQLLEREVSYRELEERVTMAAAGAFQTSPEVQKTFQDFYGIGIGGLTAYFLDPEVATPLLNKQYVSARIGAEAARNQISADRTLAEMLQVEGVTADEARAGFQKVASQRELTTGRGDVVSQQTLIQGNLLGNQAAQQEMERVGMSRVGRFQGGGGGFVGTQQGPSGLREATT